MPTNSRHAPTRTRTSATATRTGTSTTTAKRVSPSRLLRLNRTLAVLAEQVPILNQDQDDDPWPDVPEELEPIDDDALDEEDLRPARERRRQPAIVFSRVTTWAPPADAVPAEPYVVHSDLRVRVRRPDMRSNDEPWTDDLDGGELQRVASALDHLQGRALRAASRAEAFVCLETMSQKRLAEEAEISTSFLARRRREIVEAPWGLAPLEFFWWKRAQGLNLVEARLLAQVLKSSPDLEARTAARRVAEVVAAPHEVASRTDAIRKQVPVMRSLLPLLPTLNLLSGALTDVDFEELDDFVDEAVQTESGSTLDRRGRGLLRLVLAGALTDEEQAR